MFHAIFIILFYERITKERVSFLNCQFFSFVNCSHVKKCFFYFLSQVRFTNVIEDDFISNQNFFFKVFAIISYSKYRASKWTLRLLSTIGMNSQISSWSPFRRSTGNIICGHYLCPYFLFPPFCPPAFSPPLSDFLIKRVLEQETYLPKFGRGAQNTGG